MTTTTSVSARRVIEQAARGHYRTVYTPSVLEAASTVLADLHAAGLRHGIGPADWQGFHGTDHRLAEAVLLGQATAYRQASLAGLDDPLALLTAAADRAGLTTLRPRTRPDLPGAPRDGGVATFGVTGAADAAGPAPRASIRLARLPRTPPWGWDGMASLVVSLDRFDNPTSPAWKWELFPDVGEPSTQMVQVVAPPPSPAVADEVLAIAHQALTGALRLYR
ncbi:hypothetical protein AB0B89_07535 [Sphaerisporangium sp. NPDC049002]|uniref:hypothetical protein n=1 Tax=unclassified Sphaerisporangium TaxID=2630420 RepID=UPI0033DD3F64